MQFKPWQWIVLGIMACAALGALAAFGMLLSQSRSSTGDLAIGLVASTATPAVTPTPSTPPSPTPRPTNTRVVVPTSSEATTPVPPTPNPDDYFPLAVGYHWVYQNESQEQIVREVTELQVIDGQVYYIVSEQVGELGAPDSYLGNYRYQLQSDGILLENYTPASRGLTGYAYGPYQPILKIPLANWRTWSWTGRRFEENKTPVELQITWEAYPETIGLPSGEFSGYRILAIGTEGAVIRWYAAGVGLVEQSIAGSPRESFKLVEYWVGQNTP